MLIGYVSDEWDVAIAGALLEFRRDQVSVEARSRASGAVHAELEPGEWQAVLACPGFGRKFATVTVDPVRPTRFRLLSDTPYGYAWPKAVRAGERAELRIHAPGPYHLTLWRYGWSKELVRDLGYHREFAPHGERQILPDGDFTVGGCRWNEHGYSYPPHDRQHIEAPQRPGLYYVHVTADDGSWTSFPWVVAPDRPRAPTVVLASDITWNTYNDFGGRSNYVTAHGLPLEPVINSRQDSPWFRDTGGRWWNRWDYDPLTFDRPEPMNAIDPSEEITDRIERIGQEHLAPAEWRFLGWLEREGFPCDLYSETQFHAGILDLDAYRVAIIQTHPEYWSREMYDRMKSWVFDRGGRLMYLGGNGVNCAVEFVDGGRAIIVRNTDMLPWVEARSFRDVPESRGPTRISKVIEPEERLLGVRTTLTGMGTAAPYRVHDASHWIFDGTGLVDGDLFGFASLDDRNPGGASGHETDKMTEESPPGTRLLAKGINPDNGGGDVVHFETASGGQVFSVGSICWTCSIAVDEGVSHITANVLRRFLG